MTRERAEEIAEYTDRRLDLKLWRGKTYREFWDWYSAQHDAIEAEARGCMTDDEYRDFMTPIWSYIDDCGLDDLPEDKGKMDRVIGAASRPA